ncbi:Cytochrome P450 superfamily [Synechococcus sp. PCC 7335]|uniref:cytochrome P450 n=1 Tax=Synechococcus sp. (strain ATCC 29403 / PCC 7335) TaxID=91464 RepID=UPI00017ED96D|nr:cytochrome P450 [Synechococcus sp. PCC 7335]EDX86864.1 Cytochrome P450 superfamily [Synechococcus sp. PCC 7335]
MINSQRSALPPGDFGLPIIGKTLDFFTDPDFASKQHARHGPLFKTRLLNQPTVFIKGPDATRFLFSQEGDRVVVTWPPSVKALLGPLSLALQTGSVHAGRRRLMAQAFQPRALEGYIDTMVSISDRYFQQWTEISAQDDSLTWYPQLRRYTFDIACKLLVGLDDASKTTLGNLFEVWCAGLFSLPINLPWTAFGKAKRSRERLLVALEALIRDREQSSYSPATPDALELLLTAKDDDGNSLTIEELKDQVLLLLFARHETLTSALTSFCLLMAQHPEIRAKAEVEQNELADQRLTLETLKQMTYLEQKLKEVLRMVPPVGGGFRRVLKTCEFDGYQIPAGWMVLYQIKQTHQELEIYAQAKKFDPERFDLEQFEQKRKPFSYIPFGGGLRECLGKEFARLEMKIFAAKLLRDHRWELLPEQDLAFTIAPTPVPKDGLKVKFF